MLRDTFFTKAETEPANRLGLAVEEAIGFELPIDLFRSGNHLIVRAPILGADIKKVNVSIGNNQLTIHKTATPPTDSHDPDRIYLQECHWDELSRTIDLPPPVKPHSTPASLPY